jgi:ABC-type transport system substrate-binding protein
MQQILSDTWRRSGFDMRTVVTGIQHFTQLENRNTLPGFSYAAGGTEATFRTSQIGSPANRWAGTNRAGWASPEYDLLYDAWNATLDQTERGRYVAQMMALVSQDLPAYVLYFLPDVKSWVSSLQGPTLVESSGFGQTSKGTTVYWDIQNWTLR